jgi:ethanolamine utilization protein EutQ
MRIPPPRGTVEPMRVRHSPGPHDLMISRPMPTLIARPTRIQSAGNKPKLIDEYVGRVNSQTTSASVAHMRSPAGWLEPGQTPVFDEFTIVLKGTLHVEHEGGTLEVAAGQAVIAHAGEWVRYSTPHEGGAEYIAVCLPAFSMETVHRDPR